jgi:signal transduction histidine kinase
MAVLVLAVSLAAQRALKRANVALESQASSLAASNVKLQSEIVERAKVEEALRQSQKMEAIGQLSGGIAHDFNNLITIIQGNLRLLKRRLSQGRADIQPYLDAAGESLNRAALLTQRILAFSRQQPLSPRAVDLNRLIDGMGDLLRHSVGDLVQFEWRLAADWPIFCDDHQMETVILNIAINARDAMPDGGSVVVKTANLRVRTSFEGVAPGDYVSLMIRDTGTGMSEDVRRKAIDPFFTTKPPGRGTGLGLSMTFGFVQQSGGHLQIESELGKGTMVTILMPRHVVDSIQVVS